MGLPGPQGQGRPQHRRRAPGLLRRGARGQPQVHLRRERAPIRERPGGRGRRGPRHHRQGADSPGHSAGRRPRQKRRLPGHRRGAGAGYRGAGEDQDFGREAGVAKPGRRPHATALADAPLVGLVRSSGKISLNRGSIR